MAETLLLEVGIMFAAVALASIVAPRLGISAIPLYILAGMGANRYVAGRLGAPVVTESAFVTVGAELGIVFLLFFLGLEFNLDRLIADRSRVLRAGLLDLVINMGLGICLGYLLLGAVVPAVLVGGIVYVSSSAVITKTMLDLGWIVNPESGPILGTLVFEDLVIAVYLAVVSAVVLGGGSLGLAARSVGIALGFLLALVLFVALGAAALERTMRTSSAEYLVLRAVGITVLVAGAALSVGVSEAVAAFFVGMAFSGTGLAHELERSLVPLRDTFAAVFFFWIGLLTDPLSLPGVAGLIAATVVVSVPAKLLSGYLGGRGYALDQRRSLRVGLGLVTRGEFSLIIAAVAVAGAGRAIPAETAQTIYALAVGYVLVMTLLGTALMQHAARVEDWLGTSG